MTAFPRLCLAGILPGVLTAFAATAQEPVPPNTTLWGSAYFMGGGASMDHGSLFRADLDALAPGSKLLQADLSDHIRSQSHGIDEGGSSSFAALVGIHPFRGQAGPGPELRLGLFHSQGRSPILGYLRERSFPYDTMTSSATGSHFVVDSTSWSRYSMWYRAERFGLDGSLVFRTNDDRRWNLYGGAGIGIGITLNARTMVRHKSGWAIDAPYAMHEEHLEKEEFRNENGLWFSGSLPMGVGFRLARRGDLLRRLDLFLEWRPQLLYRSGDELGARMQFGRTWLFGLRTRLHG